jgi:hypothetical protein
MRLEFKRLPEVKTADIIDLMNNPQVRKEMPLTKSNFNEDDARAFVAGKEQLWKVFVIQQSECLMSTCIYLPVLYNNARQ